METGTHSIWIGEQMQELSHEVILAYLSLSRLRSWPEAGFQPATLPLEIVGLHSLKDSDLSPSVFLYKDASAISLTTIQAREMAEAKGQSIRTRLTQSRCESYGRACRAIRAISASWQMVLARRRLILLRVRRKGQAHSHSPDLKLYLLFEAARKQISH